MVGDKFEVTTWQFGSIHQSKVFVIYPGSKDPMDRDRIGVCLSPGRTRKEAMQRGLDWVAAYKAPDSPDELSPKLFRRWKTIYRTRVDIIDHLFFVIGNGYSWLDGAMVCTSDDGETDEFAWETPKTAPPGSPKYMSDEYFELPREQQRVIDDAHYSAREAAMPIGPLPDDGRPRNFYPVCQYSAILCIPDDVRPDWLAVAYEAALMLRDRQIPTAPEKKKRGLVDGKLQVLESAVDPHEQARCDANIAYGKRVVDELEAKYPHLKGTISIKVSPPSETTSTDSEDDLDVVSDEDVRRVRAMVDEILARGEPKIQDP